jgi:hypothetical protein
LNSHKASLFSFRKESTDGAEAGGICRGKEEAPAEHFQRTCRGFPVFALVGISTKLDQSNASQIDAQVFTLKEIESKGVKKGVNGMLIKDLMKELTDEGLVEVDKIGARSLAIAVAVALSLSLSLCLSLTTSSFNCQDPRTSFGRCHPRMDRFAEPGFLI